MQHHGTAKPPRYDLGMVNTKVAVHKSWKKILSRWLILKKKVALFWGDNDWLAAKEDLCKIMTQVIQLIIDNLGKFER